MKHWRRKAILASCLVAVFLAGRQARLEHGADSARGQSRPQRAGMEEQKPEAREGEPIEHGSVRPLEREKRAPDWSRIPLSEEEQKSARSLVRLQAQAEKLKASEDLLEALGKANLKPVIVKDGNEFTGKMKLVRTSNALPGTRYLHAQIFGEEGERPILQHISFEIRPGADSMQKALAWIREAYGDLGAPEIHREDYVLWRTPQHRVISARRLNAEDLKNNYFNAHSPEDVGAIWVVNELDPESEG